MANAYEICLRQLPDKEPEIWGTQQRLLPAPRPVRCREILAEVSEIFTGTHPAPLFVTLRRYADTSAVVYWALVRDDGRVESAEEKQKYNAFALILLDRINASEN